MKKAFYTDKTNDIKTKQHNISLSVAYKLLCTLAIYEVHADFRVARASEAFIVSQNIKTNTTSKLNSIAKSVANLSSLFFQATHSVTGTKNLYFIDTFLAYTPIYLFIF